MYLLTCSLGIAMLHKYPAGQWASFWEHVKPWFTKLCKQLLKGNIPSSQLRLNIWVVDARFLGGAWSQGCRTLEKWQMTFSCSASVTLIPALGGAALSADRKGCVWTDFEQGLPDQHQTTGTPIGPVHLLEQTNKQSKRNHKDIFYPEFISNLAYRKHTVKLHCAFPSCDLLKL